jgi:D-alanyl-D-alanine endopeptidase (penicillin-binding protein 7)
MKATLVAGIVMMLMIGSLGSSGTAPQEMTQEPEALPEVFPAVLDPGPLTKGRLMLRSNSVLVLDEAHGQVLFSKNPKQVVPIASITKLMSAMVVLDAALPMDEPIAIDRADLDGVRHTGSRLKVKSTLSRKDLLWVALMASENRAAAALARTYPGGTAACVTAMNQKARELGMIHTRYIDATGLSVENVSSAEDLSLLVRSAYRYPFISEATTSTSHEVTLSNGQILPYVNSNGLVKNRAWTIGLSKTGYIEEAGQCLVMRAEIAARPVIIVLLDSWGKYTRLGDANRIRHWMEAGPAPSHLTGRP